MNTLKDYLDLAMERRLLKEELIHALEHASQLRTNITKVELKMAVCDPLRDLPANLGAILEAL
jgi:hypothetical protein